MPAHLIWDPQSAHWRSLDPIDYGGYPGYSLFWIADDLPPDVTPSEPMYRSAEWLRGYLANLPDGATPLFGLAPVAKAAAAAMADDPQGDIAPPHEPSPVDAVIDSLSRDRVSRSDRGRLGDVPGKADARADGNKAGAGEAFGRIAGR